MMLVTRCPACNTTFKIVRDQLRISEGWVRCGRCNQVFDASIELREMHPIEAAAGEPMQESQEPESHASDESALVTRVAQSVSAPPMLEGAAAAIGRDSARAITSSGFSAIGRSTPTPVEKAVRRARAKAAKIERARDKATARRATLLIDAEAATGAPGGRDAAPESAVVQPTPSFARATPSFRWLGGGRGPRRTLLVAAGLATFLLGFQVLQHERDAIVARQPALRPAIVAWCGLVGCEVSALRQISAITIDGAAFTRESGGGYRLAFTLRNEAGTPLAMPAVELSLLDTQEKPVVRRVLRPAEFGAPSVLPARAERPVILPLVLSMPESSALLPVAGYRVVAFYP